jgi:hypothetical protein
MRRRCQTQEVGHVRDEILDAERIRRLGGPGVLNHARREIERGNRCAALGHHPRETSLAAAGVQHALPCDIAERLQVRRVEHEEARTVAVHPLHAAVRERFPGAKVFAGLAHPRPPESMGAFEQGSIVLNHPADLRDALMFPCSLAWRR